MTTNDYDNESYWNENPEDGTRQRGITVREDFGGSETTALAELSANAAASQARAMVEARYIIALKRPRDPDMARLAILKDCKRPGFAAGALYSKPLGGKKIRGLSIRFAESAMRAWRNVDCPISTIYDDAEKRIVRVTVTDLEANISYQKDLTIQKVVERRQLREGQVPISRRQNATGQMVYLVEASEDEIATKEAALASKALRQAALRLIPADILEEARKQVEQTILADNAKDPDAKRKEIADNFGYFNIGPDRLADYLGHPLAQVTPDEMRDLVEIYNALRDGETSWNDVMATRKPAASTDAPSSGGTATDRLSERLAKNRQQASTPTESTAAAASDQASLSGPVRSEAPPAAGETLTPAQFNERKSKLDMLHAELMHAVGNERANAAWTGALGVKSLRGVKTAVAFEERFIAANALLEKAQLAPDFLGARAAALAMPDGAAKVKALGPDVMHDPMTMTLGRAVELMDAFLDLLGAPKQPAREPGAD